MGAVLGAAFDAVAGPGWIARLAEVIDRQRPHLALWSPVLFGIGISAYFALPAEPLPWALAALGATLLLGVATLPRLGPGGRILLVALGLVPLGLEWAALRSLRVAAPVLPREMSVNVEGRVIGLDRSASDRTRILLDEVVLHGIEPRHTPARVRVSLDPSSPTEDLRPGVRLLGYARLSPPPAPAEPGAFDFRRDAWFRSLGAIGYSRTPFLETEGSRPGLGLLAFRTRMAFSGHIQARIPGQEGAFAAAILSGDRSAIDREVEGALRLSNLYHLVSISGLHMSLLAAAVFALVRYGLALVPWCALRWPLKKIAAAVAIAVGFGYLALSGYDVPAQRAFVMTTAVLVAVLLDRPALTLRAVALAAMIVLVVAPESLVQAGFQMSFAATIALVAGFEALRRQGWWQRTQTEPGWRYLRPVLGIAMTSLVAGSATAPIAAFHFGLVTHYGLIANLLAVPAMGLVVMPAAVAGVMLIPLGLDGPAFWLVGKGIGYILGVSAWVASLGGAATGVPSGPPLTLGLLILGGLWAVLWIGRGRALALLPMALGLGLWAAHPRPEVLIADSGRFFGVLGSEGRVLSSAKGNGFAADTWLAHDGDTAGQAAAAARPGLERHRGGTVMALPGGGRFAYRGSKAPEPDAAAVCADAAVLVAPRWTQAPAGGCLFVGAETLQRSGAIALHRTDHGLRLEGARARNTARPWTRDPSKAG